MAYSSMEECLLDLEKNGQLVRIKEETDPHLQMAAIHLRVYEAGGPALLFENVKGEFRAASNIFGTLGKKQIYFPGYFTYCSAIDRTKKQSCKGNKAPVSKMCTRAWQHLKHFP